MDCKNAQNLMDSAFTGDVGPSSVDRSALEAHLSACEACRVEYQRNQQALGLVKRYGKLGSDTIQLLEASGQEVPDHHRPAPEMVLEISEAQVEAGLAKLMAAIDQKEEAQEPHRPMTLGEGVADLRRRVNTIEAHQAQWRHPGTPGSLDRAATSGGWQSKLYYAAGIAACLAVTAVLGWMSLSATQQSGSLAVQSYDATSLIEWVTADGTHPIPVGEPIHSGNQRRELLLGGLHRVVLNTGTTATVNAQDGAFTIDLAQGELYVEVVPGASLGFVVVTPNAHLTITGTKFNVNADPGSNQTELTLLKGSVRFASLEGTDSVDVTAGHASSLTGKSAPTPPQPVDALATTAWARQVAVGHAIARIDPSLDRVDVGDLLHDALVSDMPDYRNWNYDRFRDKHRDWFAKQFPWVMTLEKTLQEAHNIDADYLDILVVSGDIWQFNYPGPRHISGPTPVFHPAAIERLADWYGLEAQPLLGTLRQHSNTHTLTEHTGEAFAVAVEHWRSDIVQADQHKFEDLSLFSLKASAYLAHTRAALYLWLQEHPEEAARLLASDDYADTFLASPMTVSAEQQPAQSALLVQIDRQIDASAECYQQTQQFLMVPGTEPCPADAWAEIQRRFSEGLGQIITEGEGDQQ